jgi:16S rRNA (cytosine967-C5)-methyltransferase
VSEDIRTGQHPRPNGVSPARACAYAVVRRVFERDAYADRALAAEAKGLAPRDRSLAMSLAYGTVQRRATLDHVASRFCTRPLVSLEPGVLAALELGLLQLLYLDGIADHAAVHESVELAKRASRGGAGLVNAVLRRAAREGPALLDSLTDEVPAAAAVKHSVPLWLAELWWAQLGAERARALLAQINEPAESAVRVNTLVSTPEDVISELPVTAATVPDLDEALVLEGPFDIQGSELFRRGAIMAQARGSMLAAQALAPSPGARVLDLCAAPGAKASQLGALIENRGELVAVERHPGRAQALRNTLARMRVSCAQVQTTDAATFTDERGYDAVLVDPPCSGLGTLQSRPDLRWRTSPERIAALSVLQTRILRAAAEATVPGGALVYSVCTISRAEGSSVVETLLRERDDFVVEDVGSMLAEAAQGPFLQTLPDRDRTDGFFIARLRKRLP